MIEWTSPVWLAALAALALPVLIHLWNRRPRRTVDFGSIQLLAGAPTSRSRSRRITRWPLLLVRCLLLALLALLLAGPLLERAGESESGPGWVLVSPELLRDWRQGGRRFEFERHQFEESIRSLQAEGRPLRMFHPGFDPVSLAEGPLPEEDWDPWSLLRALEVQPEAPAEVWLFTSDRIRGVPGRRPHTRRRVHWNTIGVRPDALLRRADSRLDPLRTARVRHGEDRRQEARYLEAALEAIEAWSERPAAAADPPLLFQLGEDGEETGEAFFRDSGALPYRRVERLLTIPGRRDGSSIRLWRRSDAPAGTPLWLDSAGEPLLVAEEGSGSLRLATRLHPQWSELVFTPAFVEAVHLWLDGETGFEPGGDLRLDPQQLLPAPAQDEVAGESASRLPLAGGFWLLLAGLFCLERWWADREGRG